MSTLLYDEVLRTIGGDPDSLPDRLKTTYLKAMCEALGIDTSEISDNLKSSYLEAIIKGYSGGGGGGGDSGENKFPQIVDRTITEVTAEDLHGATKIGAYAFSECKSLTSVTIPNGVMKLETAAFSACENLISVSFLGNMTGFDNSVFKSCKSLPSIIIPEGVTSIGTQAFYSCSKLKKVILPSSLTEVKSMGFGNCVFDDLTVLAETPPSMASSFTMQTKSVIRVPASSVEAYKAATNWSTHADKIVAIEE